MKPIFFGIISLLVLTLSLSSVFAQTAEPVSPIKAVLDLTRENLLESLESVDKVPQTAQIFYDMGDAEYQKAIVALDKGDFDEAEKHALIAMALFENSAEELGVLEEKRIEILHNNRHHLLDTSVELYHYFCEKYDIICELDPVTNNEYYVVEILPGITNQIHAANIFGIEEAITDSTKEAENLRGLIKTNNLDVKLDEYDSLIHDAKESLFNGNLANAQTILELANEEKNTIYAQINEEVNENQDERIQEFVENSMSEIESLLEKGENIGLTKKVISELEETLEILKTGEIDEILERTKDDDSREGSKDKKRIRETARMRQDRTKRVNRQKQFRRIFHLRTKWKMEMTRVLEISLQDWPICLMTKTPMMKNFLLDRQRSLKTIILFIVLMIILMMQLMICTKMILKKNMIS